MHKINKLLALFFFLLHCCLHRKCLRSRIWSKQLPALNKKSMSTITLRPTCRTKRNLRRIDHGCIFTDCSTSLCSRMFSNICSLVESWLWAPSPPIEMPVLWNSQAFDSHCVDLSNGGVLIWWVFHLLARAACVSTGSTSIAFYNVGRITGHGANVSHLTWGACSSGTVIAFSSTTRASV